MISEYIVSEGAKYIQICGKVTLVEKTSSWESHLENLTDFWESNLFGVRKFKGRPGQKHIMVDQAQGHTISVGHFEQWLALWFRTVDELFQGELAERAKQAALNIGQRQLQLIMNARPH